MTFINFHHYLSTNHTQSLNDAHFLIKTQYHQITICKEELNKCLDIELINTKNKINDLKYLRNKIKKHILQLCDINEIDLEVYADDPNYKSSINLYKPIPFETHTGIVYMECEYWNESKEISYDQSKCRNNLVEMYSNLNKINNLYVAIELHRKEIYKIIMNLIEKLDIEIFKFQIKNRYYRLRNSIIKILQKNVDINLRKIIKIYKDLE